MAKEDIDKLTFKKPLLTAKKQNIFMSMNNESSLEWHQKILEKVKTKILTEKLLRKN